ncbi:F-box/RNI-like/FBD-like domains-containing protein [Raphanus sativus]|uniref:F-box/LRR-repeat protein At1g48400 n=1 Tax=Raphanus sativus TaxID=3726 RepID=A0A6J0LUQ9_RAPSA|nr:F-box/LRR-repeat protein At1g48400 [Raphanus sativus]KAJ4881770.1 F-box/RNI-like/FBD-like domains-containing protein [Raphanus sativus]
MDSSREDLISNLPDEILGRILSLVPTKVAASTSALSKRWRNLLCLIDSLCFDESAVVYPNEEETTSGSHRFLDFVENTFALLSKSPIIKKLSLSRVHVYGHGPHGHSVDTYYLYARVCSCFTRWITTALGRGLLELHLHAARFAGLEIETELLTSNTLVKLTISCEFFIEVKRVFLPALKSLSLLSVSGLDHPNYCRLIDGCSLLEDLYIRDGDYPVPPGCGLHVQSASIKRLVVYTGITVPSHRDRSGFYGVVCFDAPSLVYLDYSSYVAENYEFIDLDMLVEVRLSLKLWDSITDYDEAPIFGDVTNLVLGIRNITTLHLSPESLETFHFCCKSMPVFSNLLKLSIESDKEKGWQAMPLLLKSCPNLETLVIKGLVHRVTNRCGDACPCIFKKQKNKRANKKRKIVKEEEIVCCLETCHVKVLEISEYGGSFQELKQMRHFLGKLECLETVKVAFNSDNNNNREFLWANLLALPRVSLKCNLHFI